MRKRLFALGLACAVALAGAVLAPAVPALAETQVVLPEGGVVWEEGKTVYYQDDSPKPEGDKDYTGQYATMVDALKAVYQSAPEGTATLYCRPKADVGAMTHAHVADSLTIYGNDAYVSGGERDFEIDTYKYGRTTGAQASDGVFLDKDVTLTVKGLDGAAAWGQRNTGHKITLVFEDCQNMNRVYFSGESGPIDLTIEGCSFDASKYGSVNTSVYASAPGALKISDTSFTGIAVPVNINNKKSGTTRTIEIENCIFTDCSSKTTAADQNALEYAAPVRVTGRTGSSIDVNLSGLSFVYSEGIEQCGNGDVLLGDGRSTGFLNKAAISFTMSDTDGTVMVQSAGYHSSSGVKPDKAQSYEAKKTDTVSGTTDKDDPIVVACAHLNKVAHAAVEATCTKEGVEAYWECPDCGKLFSDEACSAEIEKPVAIAKLEHSIVTEGAKEATCTLDGYTGDKVCEKCGETFETGKLIPANGHASDTWVVNSTRHWKVCDACKAEFAVEEHSYGEWKVVEEATVDKAGSKQRVCEACGDVETAELPKLERPAKPESNPSDKDEDLPKAGDASSLIQVAVAAVGTAAVAAGSIVRRKR